MKIILLRHGESQWNLENRFTGWKDVELTDLGRIEAEFSGQEILRNNIKVNAIHSSLLKRSIETASIVAKSLGYQSSKIKKNWRLNERHYGELQGLNKSETAEKFGEHQVHIWRRSYNIPPPPMKKNDKRHPIHNDTFKNIDESQLPSGESLKDVVKRLEPFWFKFFNQISKDKNYLIVAHSNSLRAIVKIIEDLSEKMIVKVEIPTGVPLVYDFDNQFKIIKKEFLIEEKLLKLKQESIINQGKVR